MESRAFSETTTDWYPLDMVRAILNYLAPLEEKPRTYLVDPPAGTPWRNFKTDAVRVAIELGFPKEFVLQEEEFRSLHSDSEFVEMTTDAPSP